MKTTSLFVELIVIGIGATLGISLLLLAVFDSNLEILGAFAKINSLLLTAIGIAIVYPIGIIIDRVADRMLSRSTTAIRKKVFSDREFVLAGIVDIYTNSSPLVDMIEYGRSRMRICRGWLIDVVLIFIGGNVYLVAAKSAGFEEALLFSLFCVLLWCGFYFAWQNLTFKGFEKISGISQILRKNNHTKSPKK
ncbi:MAG: hypothetical protein DHS20C18_00300 [Saprospiraceae bacterium]|nr:MAG: hypothetical protein DHS20C18_00300 [Saprospiraceae bacterium]